MNHYEEGIDLSIAIIVMLGVISKVKLNNLISRHRTLVT